MGESNFHFYREGLGIEFFTTSNFYQTFSEDSKILLEAYKLHNKSLMRDDSVPPPVETVEWSQASRCWWSCREEYWLVDYRQDGNSSNPVVKVYVAKYGVTGKMLWNLCLFVMKGQILGCVRPCKEEVTPPIELRTDGYNQQLHFGFLNYGGENQAIYFVIHPKDWYPYQRRFKKDSFTNYFNARINTVEKSDYNGTTDVMKIGSIVYNSKTIIEELIGTKMGLLTDGYFGKYLRYIG